jgi:hypothetical protein
LYKLISLKKEGISSFFTNMYTSSERKFTLAKTKMQKELLLLSLLLLLLLLLLLCLFVCLFVFYLKKITQKNRKTDWNW